MEILPQFWLSKATTVSIAMVASYNDITDFLINFGGLAAQAANVVQP